MFSLFEWYLLASYGYPCASFLHMFLKRSQYEAEIESKPTAETKGVTFLIQETRMNAPVYMGSSNVHIPVGGGLTTEWKEQGSAVMITSPKNVRHTFLFMKPAIEEEFETGRVIANELAVCKPVLEHYGMYDKIPVSLPMQLRYFTISGKEVHVHMKTGLIDNNKTRLLHEVQWKKRLSGTIVIPLAAFIVYGLTASAGYYPRTDIWGKIKKTLHLE